MAKKKITKIEWVYHSDYFKIALDNYKNIKRLKKEHDSIRKKIKHKKKIPDAEIDLLAKKQNAMGQLAIVVIIFSVSSLEAYINHYAISRLSRNYLKKYLDKLDLLSKWIVLPRIITGKQLDPGSKSVQELRWLINLRNKMVHYKSRKQRIDDIKESDFIWGDDAGRALKTVRNLLLQLKKIDKEVNTDWLKIGLFLV